MRYSTPRSAHARTTARTASTPRRCPATRGRKRCFAQRPLPSMMMATCRGTSPCVGNGLRRARRDAVDRRLALIPPSAPLPSAAAACRSRRCAGRSASAPRPARGARRPRDTSFFFSSSFRWWIASRRMLRTATRAFSASWRTTLISSLRRSSVSAGIGTRTISPCGRRVQAEVGVADRLLDRLRPSSSRTA